MKNPFLQPNYPSRREQMIDFASNLLRNIINDEKPSLDQVMLQLSVFTPAELQRAHLSAQILSSLTKAAMDKKLDRPHA